MKKHENFLKFNGKTITYLSKNGNYWIPIKPILEALNMDSDRSIKTLKNDPILGSVRSVQTVQVANNGIIQGRKMTCIPEKFVYGWIFSLRSDSKQLIEYKRTCYELLYNHFHGTITNRKELLLERQALDAEINQIRSNIKSDERSVELRKIEYQRRKLSEALNKNDAENIRQTAMFN